ncbi:hypothetical protein PSU4_17070 [Pseudonocardia sulfidoxydans NBRC 16205]|uniref:Uncharacterized protein n=1 Tax=Pseudonocardia sulfidoxydans NBRC 16205 TaxID=1223511 RepID=A0A511DEB1_9PSEU|nr:hypothetical protein [Pseudonocardia sulfidoxydans]GEL22753.1 hypothetical protein PSU4_17070 [Pseudonocardia sulfidoxydans NBRC 16205]
MNRPAEGHWVRVRWVLGELARHPDDRPVAPRFRHGRRVGLSTVASVRKELVNGLTDVAVIEQVVERPSWRWA